MHGVELIWCALKPKAVDMDTPLQAVAGIEALQTHEPHHHTS